MPTNLVPKNSVARKKPTFIEALLKYVRRRKQAKIVELFGTVEFDPKYDYKKQRRRS